MVRSYLVGTQVQEKSGRVKVKVEDLDGAKWVSRGRLHFMRANPKEDLTEFHRVFHKDGDIANDDPRNLTAIKFSGVRYDLKHSRVVYQPKQPIKAKPYIPKRELSVA